MNTYAARQATDKQVALIRRVAGEKDTPVAGKTSAEATIIARFEDVLGGGKFVSTREASAVIDWLFALPRKATPAAENRATEPGVYQLEDGSVVKVQANKAGTNVYAKRWVEINGYRATEAGEHVQGEWEYAPGLIHRITADQRMTLEQAKAFILRYGQCARCARKLKAAASVEAGIGPVCIKYFSF